jgi:hypothetical protein
LGSAEAPQFWKTKCEKYFAVYGLQAELWVRVATLHFASNAARWLQVHEKQGIVWNWENMCELILEKFGREHYQQLVRQFNTLKQTSSVTDYMQQFEDLMHQILAHNPAIDALFFTQFLEGIKSEVKSAVVLHRPRDLDTAFSLATMQEELLEAQPQWDFRHQTAEAMDVIRRVLSLRSVHRRRDPCFFRLLLQLMTGVAWKVPVPPITAHRSKAMVKTASGHCVPTAVRTGSASNAVSAGVKAISVRPLSSCMWSKNCWTCYRPSIMTKSGLMTTLKTISSCPCPSWLHLVLLLPAQFVWLA